MESEPEEEVAGVTFHLVSAVSRKNATGTLVGRITLDCDVPDEETWKTVEAKFRGGHRVYTEADFHTEVLDVLREKLGKIDDERLALERELAKTKDALAMAREEIRQYKEPLATLGRALRGGT